LAVVKAFFTKWMVAGKLTAVLGAAVGFTVTYPLGARRALAASRNTFARRSPARHVALPVLCPVLQRTRLREHKPRCPEEAGPERPFELVLLQLIAASSPPLSGLASRTRTLAVYTACQMSVQD